MKSTRRPLVVVAAGVTLTVVSGMATLSARLDASSLAGPGQFAVASHDGMAPGGVPALVLLLGLLLIGVGAAMHDGRELRRPSRRPVARPTVRSIPRPVFVITTAPVRPVPSAPRDTLSATRRRRTATGTRIELVGTVRGS